MTATPNPTGGKGIRDVVGENQETYQEWRKEGVPPGGREFGNEQPESQNEEASTNEGLTERKPSRT